MRLSLALPNCYQQRLSLRPPGAALLALIKPQFEVGRGNVGKGGVVRDADLHAQTTARIAQWLTDEMGWSHIGTVPSPIDGPDGNREFLIAASKSSQGDPFRLRAGSHTARDAASSDQLA